MSNKLDFINRKQYHEPRLPPHTKIKIRHYMKAKSIAYALSAVAVAISPVAASAIVSDSPDTAPTITAVLGESISVTANSPGNINVTPVSGGAQSSVSHVVTVNSSVAAGFDLTLSNGDTTVTLAGPSGNTIAASTNTYAAPAALANNSWGYAVAALNQFDASYSALNSATSSISEWAGVPSSASPQNIKTTSSVASNDQTTVWYSVKADTTKVAGNYTDTVLYTGTTK